MPWFAKIERGLVPKDIFDRHVPAHLDYVRELIAAGHQARSGYWQRRGGGMMIFQAESYEAAQAIIDRDPLVVNGCVEYELYHWCIVAEPTADQDWP